MRFLSLFALLTFGFLTACAEVIEAPQSEIQKWAYVSGEPPSITLVSMIDNETGRGGHSSLLIDGKQLVMYDPAGTWKTNITPEYHDVVFGMRPSAMQSYKSYHARHTHHVVFQKVYVSAEVAEIAFQEALKQGASHNALCASNTSALLARIPGFEGVGRAWGPAPLMRKFAKLPNVITEKYYEDDIGKN